MWHPLQHGVDGYYAAQGAAYTNPHEGGIKVGAVQPRPRLDKRPRVSQRCNLTKEKLLFINLNPAGFLLMSLQVDIRLTLG